MDNQEENRNMEEGLTPRESTQKSKVQRIKRAVRATTEQMNKCLDLIVELVESGDEEGIERMEKEVARLEGVLASQTKAYHRVHSLVKKQKSQQVVTLAFSAENTTSSHKHINNNQEITTPVESAHRVALEKGKKKVRSSVPI